MDALLIPSEMTLELAMGIEPAATILAKYGYSLQDLVILRNQSWFNDAILRERERLRDEGYTWSAKLNLMHQSLVEDAYAQVKKGGVKFSDHVELVKLTADMTGSRKPVSQGGGGPAFQINITVPENPRGPTNVKDLIQGSIETVKPMVIELGGVTGPKPAAVAAIPLDSDLVGAG